jgi:aspartate kinase
VRIMVQKYGGTSLSTEKARSCVIQHIKDAIVKQYRTIVVVSAMGRNGAPYATDTLIHWIRQNGNALPAKEMDLLMGCGEIISAATLCSLLNADSVPAVALTGAEAGVMTNDQYGNAKIISVDPSRILHFLEQNKVVIVTGFQGKNRNQELTTLGRGGSDTTATALAAAVNAELIDIFTDVDGIMTSDPKIVKQAKPLSLVTYAEICNMANHGAKVIHPRAVEIAMQANIPLRVRSTFSKEEGTLVTSPEKFKRLSQVQDRYITGLTHVPDIAQIQIKADEGQYDLQLKVFKTMAEHQISVDFINVNPSGIVYTVFDHELDRAITILEELGYKPQHLTGCSKVSIIGGGMNGVPGIMAKIVEALTSENIQILQSADSNTTIWVLVKNQDVPKALRALHYKFNLHQ